jgi:alpha-tubulin suppressor-like RCC1 family protein
MRGLAMAIVLSGCHDWGSLSSDLGGKDACVAYVVSSDTHTCARKTNGSAVCWGDNRFGQLGTGDTANRARPTQVTLPGGLGIAKVYLPTGNGEITSDRAVFTCAIATDSTLFCWGDNRFGQLGTGDTNPRLSPTLVTGLTSVAHASNGGGHTCAQTVDGAVWCWGNNQEGQLGTGDTKPQLSPTRIAGPPITADTITNGGSHTCAHEADSSVACWGANEHGELGTGKVSPPSPTPGPVQTLGNRVGRVFAGATHTCAFTTDGAVWCWGDNRFGQLGTGDTVEHDAPVAVDPTDLPGVTEVFPGGEHTCALRTDNSLWCWGNNRFGQLGLGDTNVRLTPTRVDALGTDVAAAYAGGAHTCAVKTDGSVWCWGNNQYGQIGADVGSLAIAPTQVINACR